MSENMTERQSSDAKNIDTSPRPAAHADSNINIKTPKDDDNDSSRSSSDASFPGPGASAIAPSPSKPHSSKILNQMMNRMDPRYDSDILETAKSQRENWRECQYDI